MGLEVVALHQEADRAGELVGLLGHDGDVELFSGLFAELSLRVPMEDFPTYYAAKMFSRTRMRHIIKRNRFLLLPNDRRGDLESEDLEWNHYLRYSHRPYRSAMGPWPLADGKEDQDL